MRVTVSVILLCVCFLLWQIIISCCLHLKAFLKEFFKAVTIVFFASFSGLTLAPQVTAQCMKLLTQASDDGEIESQCNVTMQDGVQGPFLRGEDLAFRVPLFFAGYEAGSELPRMPLLRTLCWGGLGGLLATLKFFYDLWKAGGTSQGELIHCLVLIMHFLN